jgi:transposase
MTVVSLDPTTGEIKQFDRVPNDKESLDEVFEQLQPGRYGVMESGTNAWAMYRLLLPYFDRLVIAEPAKLWNRRTDRTAKTDKRDALRMAQMLCRGEIEPIYIPDEQTQDIRSLVRAKIKASRQVTMLVNEIGGLLRSWGYVGSRSLMTKSGRRDIDKAVLPKHSQRILTLLMGLLEKAEEIEKEFDLTITQEAKDDPMCKLLETIPGVGSFTALLLRAEIGDITRFKSSDELASYVGLTPRVLQSSDRCYYGRLGHWGNRWLKYGLGLLSQRISRSTQDSALRRAYWKVALRKHTNVAKVVVARKAIRIVHQMLLHKEPWDEAKASVRVKSAA